MSEGFKGGRSPREPYKPEPSLCRAEMTAEGGMSLSLWCEGEPYIHAAALPKITPAGELLMDAPDRSRRHGPSNPGLAHVRSAIWAAAVWQSPAKCQSPFLPRSGYPRLLLLSSLHPSIPWRPLRPDSHKAFGHRPLHLPNGTQRRQTAHLCSLRRTLGTNAQHKLQ